MSNPAIPTGCKGNCTYDAKTDSCTTCGRTMQQIMQAYSSSNKVRM